MKLWINTHVRKDGKFKCVYGFDNGVRRTKLRTADQIREEIARGFDIEVTQADFENTVRIANQAHGKLYYEF